MQIHDLFTYFSESKSFEDLQTVVIIFPLTVDSQVPISAPARSLIFPFKKSSLIAWIIPYEY